MGNNTSSTNQKPENSEPKSQENLQVQEDQLQVFMKQGPCKETYTAFQDCVEKAKEPFSTYYQRFLAAEKGAVEVMMKDLLPSIVWRYPVESGSPEEEKEAEKFLAYMKGGDCKESFSKSKEYIVTKCGGVFSMMTKCMDAHSHYYHQFLAAKKTAEEHMEKEL